MKTPNCNLYGKHTDPKSDRNSYATPAPLRIPPTQTQMRPTSRQHAMDWQTLRNQFMRTIGGDPPGAQLEDQLIPAYTDHPDAVDPILREDRARIQSRKNPLPLGSPQNRNRESDRSREKPTPRQRPQPHQSRRPSRTTHPQRTPALRPPRGSPRRTVRTPRHPPRTRHPRTPRTHERPAGTNSGRSAPPPNSKPKPARLPLPATTQNHHRTTNPHTRRPENHRRTQRRRHQPARMTIDPRILEIAQTPSSPHTSSTPGALTSTALTNAPSHTALDLSRTTVTDRLDAAWRTLRKHGIMVTPDGRPYLQEHTNA